MGLPRYVHIFLVVLGISPGSSMIKVWAPPGMTTLILTFYLIVSAQNQLGKTMSCGHFILGNDPHRICYACRVFPEIRLTKYHGCQSILHESVGDPSLCTICSAVPPLVKQSWFSTVPLGEHLSFKGSFKEISQFSRQKGGGGGLPYSDGLSE